MNHRKRRGHIVVRNGKVRLLIKDSAGTRRSIELGQEYQLRSDVARRREADAWIARNMPEMLTTGDQVEAGLWFEAFMSRQAPGFRKSSRRRYRSVIRAHLMPAFASTPLHQIDVAAIQGLLLAMKDKGLSRTTISGVRAVVLQILRQARKEGIDTAIIDPHLVRVPATDRPEREARYITEGELAQILAAAEMPWCALYACMGLLGLRVSEALALTWSQLDLDSDAPLARIRQSAQDGDVHPLKTLTSRADLPLPDELTAILRAFRTTWTPNDDGLLFASRTGRPARAQDIRRRQWLPLLQRLGLPPAGFHALRHGIARRLFARGCSADLVRKYLRHGSMAMTMRYSHSNASDLRKAMGDALTRSSIAQSIPGNSPTAIPAQEFTA